MARKKTPPEHLATPEPTPPAAPGNAVAHSDPTRFLIDDLCRLVREYLPEDQALQVRAAFEVAERAHEGQFRKSGEPYIVHPLAVARILAEMRLDHQTLMAALLHDVIEDTDLIREDLAERFGEEVASLVDGVTKLTQIEFQSKAEAQAENFRKMILAMAEDIRVILIKLADRLHNMRTLGAMPADKRRRIARETLDIYVPIANRLGMNNLRIELQDLGFFALHPLRARILKEAVAKARGNRREVVERITGEIQERLRAEGIDGEVYGREKHLYSIYQKMKTKRMSFREVMDVYAFRIVVDRVDTCYRALGVVHNLYKPLPGRFKDYIAIPKANGYQSLHTVLFGPYGIPIEVQIRTEDMHKVAETGVAAHWLYKDNAVGGPTPREWISSLLELQKNAGNSMEFLEHVKIDLFPEGVYVFTPKGDILELPRGATPVDFAYAVHSDIGHHCIAAKVDRQLVPLRYRLEHGQTVEILTAPGAHPDPAWLNFVVTGKARSNIRHYLKNLQRREAVALGERLLRNALDELGLAYDRLGEERMQELLGTLGLKSREQLLEQIGLGKRLALIVARQIARQHAGEETPTAPAPVSTSSRLRAMLARYTPQFLNFGRERDQERKAANRPLAIRGTEGIVVSYAKCCRPIPGDPIIGFVSAGRGIVVHVSGCKNAREDRHDATHWIPVEWEDAPEGEFPVDIRVSVVNQRGALATVAAVIAEMGANVENVALEERDGRHSDLLFTVDVKDRKHLARIMRRVRRLDLVRRINRSKG